MIEGLFRQTAIPVLEQVVQFGQARHAVLAGNVANLDTPGYRTQDLSQEAFEARLRDALARRDAGDASWSLAPQSDPVAETSQNLGSLLRHDENNVGLEEQIAAISKNQAQHNLALNVLANQFRLLQAAISERA